VRQAAASLGPLRVKLLKSAVLRDRSWRELDQLLRVSDKTAKDYWVDLGTCRLACRPHRRPRAGIRFRNEPGRW
jgi:hypothetical protein